MASIKILEDIGLKEVSRKTHIEVKFLEYIINSDFAKLNKTNSIGFAKIISREYDLDFTDWLEEAREYWDQHTPDHENHKIFIVPKPKKISKVIFTILSFVILAAILYGAYIFLNKKLNFFENTVLKKDVNYTYEETPVVSEAKKSLTKEISPSSDVPAVNESNISIQSGNEQNTQSTVTVPEEQNVSQNEKSIVPAANQPKENNATVLPLDIHKDSFISPASKLWVGVIDLNTFKRISHLGEGNYTLDPSKDQLITTGHGNFTLYFKGAVTKFSTIAPIKLLIKDGNISQITNKKFMELNRGSLW